MFAPMLIEKPNLKAMAGSRQVRNSSGHGRRRAEVFALSLVFVVLINTIVTAIVAFHRTWTKKKDSNEKDEKKILKRTCFNNPKPRIDAPRRDSVARLRIYAYFVC
jgi:hypothetical protein